MTYSWFEIGEEHTKEKENEILGITSRMTWQEIKGVLTLPFCPGEGIKGTIKEYGIPKASHIAISNELAPFGLYGIYGHYADADVRLYFVDEGVCIVPILAEIENKQASNQI